MGHRPAYSSAFQSDNVSHFPESFPLENIDPEWAWGGSTGARIRVAIIDSGIDADHPGIHGGVDGYVSIRQTGTGIQYDESEHGDVYGHGNACAGIIRSIAPEAEIYSVRVLGPALTGRGNIFAAGLEWAINHSMHICNLSLGTTKADYYSHLHELVDKAYFQNVMLVSAANNLPKPSFPSVYSSVISVASHDIDDPYHLLFNPNPPVEFGAYGIDVRVPWKDKGWITATGNSFAAPHVTGMIARILSKYPALTQFQVKTILRALAVNAIKEEPPA